MAGLWLRLYTEIRNDRKLRRLSPAQRWLWVVILTIAKESPSPGCLLLSEGVPVTIEDLADDAAISLDQVQQGIEAFEAQRMIEQIDGVWYLVNWDKRQFVSDNSTERVKKHRQKKQQNETLQDRCNDVTVTPPETETDIYTTTATADARGEQNIYRRFEQEFGRPLSPTEIEQVQKWESNISADLVAEALQRAVLAGKFNFKYIDGIIFNWQKNNIRTLLDVKNQDAEFEKQKTKGGTVRGPTKATGNAAKRFGADRDNGSQGQTNKFDSIDYSKFMYKPKPGEMPDM